MYKSKLQELCQRWRWPLPEYNTSKDGPQHQPLFTATVYVNGYTFVTPTHHRSAKEAQNNAAHIAVYNLTAHHPYVAQGYQMPSLQSQPAIHVGIGGPVMPVSPSPSTLPTPTSGFLASRTDPHTQQSNNSQQNSVQTSNVSRESSDEHKVGGKLHIYKNLLQQYAQKKGIALPFYDTNTEGPGHAPRFKSKVSVDGKLYDTQEYFTTLKEAEQAVAKIACQELSINGSQDDEALYKNLLQELVQRRGLDRLVYKTSTFGMAHKPSFVSSVELGALVFHGGEAKTKKQAELNVAKVAYCNLIKGSQPADSPKVSTVGPLAVANDVSIKIEASTRKQTYVLEEEAELKSKRAKTKPEKVNPNSDIPGPSHQLPQPSDSNLTAGEVGVEKPVDPPAAPPAEVIGASNQTIVVPRKTSLVAPDFSVSTMLPFSDEQWAAYKIESNHNSGTTA